MDAYIRGLSLTVLNPERKNLSLQALIRGVSFLVTSKVLYLKAVRWTGTRYVIVPNLRFDVLLQTATGNQVTSATTGNNGTVLLNFEAETIVVSPAAAGIPPGYRYTEDYKTTARGKNYLTITLLPAREEFAFGVEVL